MVKEAAEDAMKQTGFVYESTSGLYYDYNTGYYYNAVSINLKSKFLQFILPVLKESFLFYRNWDYITMEIVELIIGITKTKRYSSFILKWNFHQIWKILRIIIPMLLKRKPNVKKNQKRYVINIAAV